MRKALLLSIIFLASASNAMAQKLIVGDKVPQLNVSQWLTAEPTTDNRMQWLEFCSMSNDGCLAHLAVLDSLASTAKERVNFIVVLYKSDKEAFEPTESVNYYVARDVDGSIYRNFCVKMVPYAVLSDAKGRVTWIGNPTLLDNQRVNKLFKR